MGTKIARGLIEPHPTNGASYVSNTLWTNSIPIHHPEENEVFAALRAPGDKLVHKALSHRGFAALYSMGSAGLSYDGDHGAVYPLIILFALEMQTIPSTPCLNHVRVDACNSGNNSEDEFVARWAAKGRAGVLLWPGRRSHSEAANSRSSIQGWAFARNLVFLVFAKRQSLRTQSA